MLAGSEFAVVAEARKRHEILTAVHACCPRLVLLALRLLGEEGFETLATLQKAFPPTAFPALDIVVLAAEERPGERPEERLHERLLSPPLGRARVLNAGATDYLVKTTLHHELLPTLQRICTRKK